MTTYRVPMETTVTSWVEVEADSKQEAIESALQEGVPGLMHLDHTYPDEGEWDVPEWFTNDEEEGIK